jgi:hypothetical protein
MAEPQPPCPFDLEGILRDLEGTSKKFLDILRVVEAAYLQHRSQPALAEMLSHHRLDFATKTLDNLQVTMQNAYVACAAAETAAKVVKHMEETHAAPAE